jgi:hypothetical protein
MPAAVEYLPAAHDEHSVDPDASAYRPAAHKVQLAAPA